MAPAEVETFIPGEGSNRQKADSLKEFEAGTIQANVEPHTYYTAVKISGNEPHFVIRRNDYIVASGTIGTNPLQTVLYTGESIEVNDTNNNRIKVTDKSTPTQ